MSITYTFEIDGDMLKAKASGEDDSLDEVKAYGMALMEAAFQNQCARVLCDERDLLYKLGTVDTYELGQYITENIPRIIKVAIVCNPKDVEDLEFFETMTTNRGLRIRGFKELEQAIEWLRD